MSPPCKLTAIWTTIAGCLLAYLIEMHQCNAAITSQYLGAQSHGNEHLLLFKLPETISSQVLDQHHNHQQQQPKYLHRDESVLLAPQSRSSSSSPASLYFPTQANNYQHLNHIPNVQQPAQEQVEEQSISLTIPLSTIRAVEPPSQSHQMVSLADQHLNFHRQPELQLQHPPQAVHLIQQVVPSKLNRPVAASSGQQVVLNLVDLLHQQQQNPNENYAANPDQVPHKADISTTLADFRQQISTWPLVAPQQQQQQYAQEVSQPQASVYVDPRQLLPQQQQHSILSNQLQQIQLNEQPNQYQIEQQLQQQQLPVGPSLESSSEKSLSGSGQSVTLWPRPTLFLNSPPANQSNVLTTLSQIQSQTVSNATELTNLLARLTHSSPDLLLRLKNLLRRASVSHNQSVPINHVTSIQDGLQNSNHNQTTYSYLNQPLRNLDTIRPQDSLLSPLASAASNMTHGQLVINDLQTPNLSQSDVSPTTAGSGLEHQVLSTYLTGQNSTAHEEIKIPLLVIAMPRLLSLKRNQNGSNLGRELNSSLPTISSAVLQRLIRQHSSLALASPPNMAYNETGFNPLNATHAPQQPLANLSHGIQVGSPYIYVAQQHQQQQQQHTIDQTTTPSPQYTMAPYARQFALSHLVSTPLIRRYIGSSESNGGEQSGQGYKILPAPINHTVSRHADQMDQNFPVYSQYSSNSTASVDQFNRPVLETLTFVGRASSNNSSDHLVDSGFDAGASQNPTHLQLVTSHGQQQSFEPQNGNQSQQVVYLTSLGRAQTGTKYSNRSSSDEARAADEDVRLQPMVGSRIEESASGKFRPLFGSEKRSSFSSQLLGSDTKGYLGGQRKQTLLSPSQMLNFLTRAAERRSSTADSGQLVRGAEPGVANIGPAAKSKSPRMVLMFV